MRRWARKRQGPDADPVRLRRRRIYILPTRFGIAFAALVVVILLGGMNYNNSLGLALAFLLGGLMLVTMHHCHRNLDGLLVGFSGAEPVFAGQPVHFRIRLHNDSASPRYGLMAGAGGRLSSALDLAAGGRGELALELATERRGRLTLDRYSLSTTFPLGLFRAWTWVHQDLTAVVFPAPAAHAPPPPPMKTDTGGAQDPRSGDADFAGLRSYRDGDSPRHIAWKSYARGQELLVKQFAGTDVTTHWFDWSTLHEPDVEQRLSTLSRWIVDARANGRAYGLSMPAARFPPNVGGGHDRRCLTALALYDPGANAA